jgi:4-amino-4-deoxy-L-arabinose transferase-like glycosyltransferase
MWRGVGLLLLCLLTFVSGLGRSAIADSDEAFYAEAGREMAATGDWITPHYNFEPRLQKPVLFYWLVAATYRVAGVSETAARLWAALAGVGLAFVAYVVARRWSGPGPGLLAGAIVATAFGVVPAARQALPDVPLALFLSVAIWAAIEAVSTAPVVSADATGRFARWTPRGWLCLSAVAMALGMLTKGPIAVALPVAVVLPLMLWEWFAKPREGTPWAWRLRPTDLALAAGLFLLIAAPWYLAETRAQGVGYLRQFFIGENLDRFATEQFNDSSRGVGFYVPIVIGGLLPWSAFGLLWARPLVDVATRRRRLTPLDARLLCWTFGPLLLLSVSVGKQPRYILPCLVPLAILLARSIARRAAGAGGKGRDVLFTISTLGAGAMIALAGALVIRARPLLSASNPDWSPTGGVVMIAVGVVTLGAALFAARRHVPAVLAVAAAVALAAFQAAVLSPKRPEPVELMARAAREQGPVPVVGNCGGFARSFVFYSHGKTAMIDSEERVRNFLDTPEVVLATIDEDMLATIETSLNRRFPRLADVTYVNSGVWQRPATLWDPNARYLQRIILIRNR